MKDSVKGRLKLLRANLKSASIIERNLTDRAPHTEFTDSRPGQKRLSLRRQWIFSYLGTTIFVVGGITFGAWWFAHRKTRIEVEKRLTSIGRAMAAPNYPLTPTVLRAVAELTDTQLILLDRSGRIVDSTLSQMQSQLPIIAIKKGETLSGISIDHAFRGPDDKLYHAGWLKFEGTASPVRTEQIAWVGILMDQVVVRQMRWQALVLPLITGFATAIALGAIAAWLTDRVVRRLQTLQRKVQRIASGDYNPIELTGQNPLHPDPMHGDELHELSANVNRMATELQQMEIRIHATERERLVHALAAGLSHDLRNTLTGAQLAIQLHEKECRGDTESISVAMRQLRLAEDQLTRWLRLGGENEITESMPLKEILDKAIELVQPMTEHLGSLLTVERAAEFESISFKHAEMVSSAVLNLLLNAIQAAGKGGRIGLLTVSHTPAWLSIEINDSGPGPTADVQAKMFEPLITTKREGVGLGLALVAKAAKELSGKVSWRRENEKTFFSFQLPIASPLAEQQN